MAPFLKVLRLVFLVALTLLSGVVLGSSSFFNSHTTPMFHYSEYIFPFVWSIIRFLVLSYIVLFGNKRHGKLPLSSLMIELPIMGLLLIIWFICADRGTNVFFGPFRHCNLGAGVGVMSAGLDVPSHCKTVAVLHGCEWLSVLALLLFCGITGVVGVLAFYRQGRRALFLSINDLRPSGRPLVEEKTF
ncbi:hypothetical protein BDQ17DRAFT_1414992 [Cyathus striatus]|nr:hypothetical protein BDQ17DRAFT_1414992 [Cyathus striatus]